MSKKSWVTLGILFIIIVSGTIYLGTKSNVTPTVTPTPTTQTHTTISTTTSSTPLNDTAAIEQLMSTYHESVETKSLDTLTSLFTDDATLITSNQLRFSGRNNINGYFYHMFQVMEGKIDQKILQSSIELKDSKATVKVKIVNNNVLGMETFELVKSRGSWKISFLTLFKF